MKAFEFFDKIYCCFAHIFFQYQLRLDRYIAASKEHAIREMHSMLTCYTRDVYHVLHLSSIYLIRSFPCHFLHSDALSPGPREIMFQIRDDENGRSNLSELKKISVSVLCITNPQFAVCSAEI